MKYRVWSNVNGKKAIWGLIEADSFEQAVKDMFGCPSCDDPNCEGVVEHVDWIFCVPFIRGLRVEYDAV